MKTQAEKRYYRERKKLDKAFNITKDLYYKDCEKLLDKCHKERYEELKASGLYEYEVPVAVDSFYSETRAQKADYRDERDEAFIRAEEGPGEKLARKIFCDEAKSQGKKVKVVTAEFIEFDSGNITHAYAYWKITYTGQQLEDL